MRRPSKRQINETENISSELPSKRQRKGSTRLNEATTELEPEEEQSFEETVKEMKCETEKRHPKTSRLKPLLDATFSGRRHWVKSEMPPVSAIMEKFPALKIPRLVRFCTRTYTCTSCHSLGMGLCYMYVVLNFLKVSGCETQIPEPCCFCSKSFNAHLHVHAFMYIPDMLHVHVHARTKLCTWIIHECHTSFSFTVATRV